jgi:hypothetical protein
MEINNSTYETVSSTKVPLFIATKFEWKISGNRNNIIKNKIIQSTGVEEFNLEKISAVEEKFTGIKSFLSNKLTQFWRGY